MAIVVAAVQRWISSAATMHYVVISGCESKEETDLHGA
jgi:hypothetical protein